MSVNEDVFEPIDSGLDDYSPSGSSWRQKWRGIVEALNPLASEQTHVSREKVPQQKGYDEMLQLVQRVFLAPAVLSPKRVMFCGIDKNDSSYVCASAGRVLAEQTGSTVCLVDANMREALLSKQFDVDGENSGYGSLAPWREHCMQVGKNLFWAGTRVLEGSRGGLAPSSEIRERIMALSATFEYLLFDAPGANESADTALLGQVAGSVVLVLDAKSTRRVQAKKAKERLEMANIRILGTVLNNHS